MDCTGWIRIQEAIQTHSWPIVTWRHTMADGPCVTLLMNMSNPRLKSHTALSFLMEVTATGPTVTTSQWVDSLMFYDRLANREISSCNAWGWFDKNKSNSQQMRVIITLLRLMNQGSSAHVHGLYDECYILTFSSIFYSLRKSSSLITRLELKSISNGNWPTFL